MDERADVKLDKQLWEGLRCASVDGWIVTHGCANAKGNTFGISGLGGGVGAL